MPIISENDEIQHKPIISRNEVENWRKGKRSDHRIQRENGGGEEAARGEVMEGIGSAGSRCI